ncbi:TIGR03016 family PEP-CTERM system-associated outer membrane protein [Massilia sp. CFBP9012]|uniref:TIGR03016 family PEP-CTERM system-associated outer membrane protein n=1 Tax=Massilia sp. CFBP9012 TaxID=3096531 RepID=UPI002A6A2E8A|nr:TIGR03016 family PEP-CTERM system-associated outer membrane protein [Massilia sp. CFBP9012]MDY0974414.1 TIGR03016 family PEP-CTERM system-associated outer membrane protein [Massilia sp. CFBP9012]
MTITTAKLSAASIGAGRGTLRLAPMAAALLLASVPAHADWRVTPTMTLSEIWTDNVNLTDDSLAHSELITQVSPGFEVTQRSRRLTVNAAAQLHAFHYLHDSDERGLDGSPGADEDGAFRSPATIQRSYRGNLRGELARDLFFIDASASRGQQNISAFGPRINNDAYSRNNRTDIETWSISPYLVHRFGNTASGQLRYTRDSVGGGENVGFRRTGGDTLQAMLASGPSFRTIGWGINYNKQELKGDRYGDSSSETLAANLSYMVSGRLALLANGGYDRYEFEGLGGGDQGANWSLGFRWTPSARTSLQATAGRHFYGNTGSLLATHRTRRTSWNLTYADTITTSRQQFLLPSTIDTAGLLDRMFATAYPDPIERARVVQAYLQQTGLPPSLSESVNYLSNRFMRQKMLRASMVYRKGRSSASLSAHVSDRNAISDQQSDSPLLGSQQGRFSDNVRQHGLTGYYTYRLNSQSNLVAGYDLDESESRNTDYRNYQRTMRVGLTRRFGDARASVDVRRRSGDLGNRTSAGTYTENSVSASLMMMF